MKTTNSLWKVRICTKSHTHDINGAKINVVFARAFGCSSASADRLRLSTGNVGGVTIKITGDQFLAFFLWRRKLLSEGHIKWEDAVCVAKDEEVIDFTPNAASADLNAFSP